LRLDLRDRGLVWSLLDDEQEIALLDVLSFVEEPLLQEAINARAQIDFVLRLDPASEGYSWRDLVLRHGNDSHGRRRQLGLGLLLRVVAPVKNEQQRHPEHQR